MEIIFSSIVSISMMETSGDGRTQGPQSYVICAGLFVQISCLLKVYYYLKINGMMVYLNIYEVMR